jgi:hypothetical protein
MRNVVVSLVTPYKENVRGTSALPYYLLNGRITFSFSTEENDDVPDCVIYSFNANRLTKEQIAEVERELNAEIRLMPLPRWYRWMFKLHLLFLRVFLKYPFVNYLKLPKNVVKEIKEQNPDLIWVNNEEMSRIPKQFPSVRRMQLGPDVESLYYYRMMGQRFVMNNVVDYWKCAMMYRKYARLERHFCTDDDFTYYAVGEADIEHLRQLNPNVNCKFLRHPHYEVKDKREIHFHEPKIRLLITGRYDLYMKQSADELIPLISHHNNGLKDNYELTFLGKGWEVHVNTLKSAGYEVNHIVFAPDYVEEVCKHDIQLTPICIGTGTKGKVLDALANGLLVIGTKYALENINVEHCKSCVQWEQASEVPDILLDIVNNRAKFEQIAEAGRYAVITKHNPEDISRELFTLKN